MSNKHECEAGLNRPIIYHNGSNWAVGGGDTRKTAWGFWITYCPYCGEKLEAPDVKVEVSKATLEEWRSCLWDVHNWAQRLTAEIKAVLDE
jgi:hypothetical protein